jgi:hypothetical protein
MHKKKQRNLWSQNKINGQKKNYLLLKVVCPARQGKKREYHRQSSNMQIEYNK